MGIETLLRALKEVIERVTREMVLEIDPASQRYEELCQMPLEPRHGPEAEDMPEPEDFPEDEDGPGGDRADYFDPADLTPERKAGPPEVYIMNLPARSDTTARIPYILIQFLEGKDDRAKEEKHGLKESTVDVRILVALYNSDGQEGGLQVLNILERLRRAFQSGEMLRNNYTLQQPLKYEVYPDDTGDYFLGEMDSTWSIPTVERVMPYIEAAVESGSLISNGILDESQVESIWERNELWN